MRSIRSIVFATDFSAPSRAACLRAGLIAKRSGAAIHVVHSARLPMPVVQHEFSIPGPEWEAIRDAAQKELDHLASDLEAQGISVTRHLSRETAVDAILEAVQEHEADLIVMGSHGHSGLWHAMLGSVAERTLRASPVPVWVVKEDETKAEAPIHTILLATDFSAHAKAAAELAIAVAKLCGAGVEICHVHAIPSSAWMSIEPPPPAEWLRMLEERAREQIQEVLSEFERAGVAANTHLVSDTPSLAIPALADDLGADLIVMGTRGLSGFRHVLLGSVAERTLRMAQCSVLAGPRAQELPTRD